MALFVLSLCPFDISVGVGAFVIGLSQISSFFSCISSYLNKRFQTKWDNCSTNKLHEINDTFLPSLRREAVVKLFLPPFACDLVRPPYVVIDSKLFSMTFSFYFRAILKNIYAFDVSI